MEVTWRGQRTSLAILRKGTEEARRAIERWLSRRPWAQPNRKGMEKHLLASDSR